MTTSFTSHSALLASSSFILNTGQVDSLHSLQRRNLALLSCFFRTRHGVRVNDYQGNVQMFALLLSWQQTLHFPMQEIGQDALATCNRTPLGGLARGERAQENVAAVTLYVVACGGAVPYRDRREAASSLAETLNVCTGWELGCYSAAIAASPRFSLRPRQRRLDRVLVPTLKYTFVGACPSIVANQGQALPPRGLAGARGHCTLAGPEGLNLVTL
jgi:hypothetical protein